MTRHLWQRVAMFARLAAAFLVLATLGSVPARADDGDRGPLSLPPDELLRLLEEGAHLEALGKTSAQDERPPIVAAESLHAYDAIHYRLDVTPSRTARHVDGKVTLTLVVRNPGFTQVDLDAVGLTFSSIKVNGTPRIGWTAFGGKLFIPVCEGPDCPPHAPGDTLVVEVTYSANPTTGYYFYPRNSYTSVEPDLARRWWPCYDQPSDKAALDLYATVPDSNSCWSNGKLIDVTPGAPGTSVWHWQETHPIATYLVCVTVANFWRYDQLAGTLPIVSVAFPEDSTKAKNEYANVPAMVQVFSQAWAEYPFDKYGQATVDPYNVGGMEHQTMTTLARSLLRGDRRYEYVWAHELAHQWWGDWVTCVDFRDIWLNEGFASFAEAYWVEQFYSAAAYDSAIAQAMTSALNADQANRYALYAPPPGQTFGTTIYKKGEAVLHMLRRVLGDAAFFDGFRLYGQRYAYGNATTRDFQHAMEDASGQPLDWFFDEWVFAAGIPTYQWSWQAVPSDPPEPDFTDVSLFVRQVQTAAPLYRMPIEFRFIRSALPDTSVLVWNDAVASQSFTVPIRGTVTGVGFDPRQSVLKRLEPYTLDVRPPDVAVAAGRIDLAVLPNPSRGAVALRGSWLVAGAGAAAAAAPAEVRFAIFDVTGRLVRNLGVVPSVPGESYAVTWDRSDDAGRQVPAGLYFAQVSAGAQREARPIVLVP